MFVLYLSLLAFASPQDPPVLTMKAAVEEAIANNPDLRMLRAEIAVAEHRPGCAT
jgi:outer membrane protein TolC